MNCGDEEVSNGSRGRGTLEPGRWVGLLKKGGRGIDGLREGILEAS